MFSTRSTTELSNPTAVCSPQATHLGAEKHTYGHILKSSALIGASKAFDIVIRMVRTKAMAVLLGPAGFGLMGAYGSIADLVGSIVGLGINSSGVRQIAEAVGSGHLERIARTVAVLRRVSIMLGTLGAILLVAFSRQISTLTFGTSEHGASVALLSLVVFFGLISGAQGALIQGMRRISDLASMGVLGSLLGTITSIPIVYLLRENGVVPSLVIAGAAGVLVSWWYTRQIHKQPPAMTTSKVMIEAVGLLKLGIAFMASGFMMLGAAYAVRTMVLRIVSFEAAGYYQAAWTLGGMYVGFILQAMGADFYPRLTGVATDDALCNRMVNEQAQISLLLAGPGVLATLTFAPVVMTLFYSAKFDAAVGILRWFCLGMALRVITWPMGFIVVAKGKQNIFFWTELAWTALNVGLSWICLGYFGLNGVGIAFFGSYVFHALLIYPIVRWLSGFHWSAANRQNALLFTCSVALVFCVCDILPSPWAMGIGTFVVILSGIYSTRSLLLLISLARVPPTIRRLLARFRLVVA